MVSNTKRRLTMKKLLVLTLTPLLLLVMVACNPTTNYQLWTTAGTLIDSWVKVYAPTFNQATLDTAWTAAGQDILNWKAGTQCQNVEQAINDALGIAMTIPVTDPKAALILSTAVVGAEVVEAFFVKCSPATMKATHYSGVLREAVATSRLNPPKDAATLKQQWIKAGGK